VLLPVHSINSFESSELAYVSKQWYNRLLTCGNPGPVDSFDIICPHGSKLCKAFLDCLEIVCLLDVRPLNGLSGSILESVLQAVPKKLASELVGHFGELGGVGVLESPIECSLCIEEAEALRKRRRREEVDVMSLDSSSISEGEFWYLIDSSWLKLWQDFKSGGPPPGAISNNRLFRASSGGKSAEKLEVRTNLIRGEHYRGINEKVWNYLYNIYGGGPVLKRPSIDIYKE
jgi:ubiquitin carboxyl-terminal hydrolase 20/33